MCRILTTTAIALGMSLTLSQVALAETWDMPTEQAETSLTGIADLAFAKAVAEKTGGAIEVKVHFGGSLGYKSADQYDAVGNGSLIIADTYTGPLVGYNPIWQVSALPFLTADIGDAKKLFEASKATYEEVLEQDGQVLLYTIPWTPSGIWSRSEVREAADIEGLKIRVFDPTSEATFRAAGAAPVILSFTDVVPQLTTGGIDAVLTSSEGGYQNKFPDLLKNFTSISYAAPLSIIHVNKDKWEALSEETRKAVMAAASETEEMIWALAVDREQEILGKMRAEGVNVVEEPADSLKSRLREAAGPAIEAWKEKTGEKGAAILSAYGG
jgi:TRAP-type C4-dicarboxylate transport system substrate-binding protein